MKAPRLDHLFWVWLIVCAPAFGGGEKEPVAAEVVRLIRELPNRLPDDCRLPDGVEPGKSLTEDQSEAVEVYQRNVKALQAKYSELKKHIAVGRSVFEYPGLLGKGSTWYDEYGGGRYRLRLGVLDRIGTYGSQGVFGPYWVWFDSNGTIVEIEDIVYGH